MFSTLYPYDYIAFNIFTMNVYLVSRLDSNCFDQVVKMCYHEHNKNKYPVGEMLGACLTRSFLCENLKKLLCLQNLTQNHMTRNE